jgi:adenylate cyclase
MDVGVYNGKARVAIALLHRYRALRCRQIGTIHFSLHVAGVRVSFEIERKFLVCGNEWLNLATSHRAIRQAYLNLNGKASVRVRIQDGGATLSIKSRPAELRRLELEYPIPVLEAEALIGLRQGAVIEKVRHLVPWHDLVWEIDVFSGENDGLIIAEIELRHEHQAIDLPSWITTEVTGQAAYYNSDLVQRPFSSWSSEDGAIQRENWRKSNT